MGSVPSSALKGISSLGQYRDCEAIGNLGVFKGWLHLAVPLISAGHTVSVVSVFAKERMEGGFFWEHKMFLLVMVESWGDVGRQPLSSSFHYMTPLQPSPPLTALSPLIFASYLPEFDSFWLWLELIFFPFRGLLGFNSSLASVLPVFLAARGSWHALV